LNFSTSHSTNFNIGSGIGGNYPLAYTYCISSHDSASVLSYQ
jgi:hypothetical protein